MNQVITGTAVVAGVGLGPALRPGSLPTLPKDEPQLNVDQAAAEFSAACLAVASRLRQRANQASGSASEVLVATAALAQDRGLATQVTKHVADGKGLCAATDAAVDDLAQMFKSAGGLMAERVTDLVDVKHRILAELQGLPEPGIPTPTTPSVLCADDLAPADTAGLNPELIVAIATRLGGATSHTAIVARQLGIPCVVAIAELAEIEAGVLVLVDGSTGRLVIDPDPQEAERLADHDRQMRERAARWTGPGRTLDQHPIQILANVQDGATARAAAQLPIEGFGLFRTELCFLDRKVEPSIDEQAALYEEVFDAAPGLKVVVRTLDAGSDKPVPYASIEHEPNPALGVRGLRIAIANPGLLNRQLDAVAQAAARSDADVRVMAPMIATEAETIWFAELVRARGLPVGVMIETPSAAILAHRILEHLDFLSIGTNDLSQYTFAADRMAPTLSGLTDPWQPALLELIRMIATAGQDAGKPVGVCGEAAAQPELAAVLTGLGVTSLSCAAPAVRAVGSTLAELSLDQCRAAAQAALSGIDATSARQLAAKALA